MPVTHADLDSDLIRARVGVDASELHGSITGYICAAGSADARHLLQALQLDIEPGPARQAFESHLKTLYQECRVALEDASMGFEPLLPAASSPLSERADALVEWCRGFLGGFGLADAAAAAALGADASEVLRDFGTIAGSELACGNDDADERALMEVHEFVRVGAMLLHAEVSGQSSAAPARTAGRVH
jgi:uncharacterized protein YgfB (UPF0149 family)